MTRYMDPIFFTPADQDPNFCSIFLGIYGPDES
jgi:hypothetical protein